MKSEFSAQNGRIKLVNNAPTQMLISFAFILTPTTTCKVTVAYMLVPLPKDVTTNAKKR